VFWPCFKHREFLSKAALEILKISLVAARWDKARARNHHQLLPRLLPARRWLLFADRMRTPWGPFPLTPKLSTLPTWKKSSPLALLHLDCVSLPSYSKESLDSLSLHRITPSLVVANQGIKPNLLCSLEERAWWCQLVYFPELIGLCFNWTLVPQCWLGCSKKLWNSEIV